ncbi:hypothetical protein KY495_04550 [Massilia sp. PAMC28688]|uniref:hypothetical protein n=1 Tax=Massilia sp. PAMC28688 TaxID=2861283 RepID=UPI001C638561|nr:hypothetical protein [Massilia sp. PAMC28688]QYF94492.1 hypothetical protein KY495_04550 [Massilia sp. PAMC28688]
MFYLRILSFLAGSAVLLGAPFLMLSARAGLASGHVFLVLLGTIAVLLFGFAYFFVALAGHRTVRSQRLRTATGALLAFQFVSGGVLLALSQNSQLLMACGALLCVSVFLFLAFVYPGELPRTHRPMRRRDTAEMLPN